MSPKATPGKLAFPKLMGTKTLQSFFSTKDSNIFPRQQLLVDPTDKEEIVMNGRMIMAMNIHREICGAVMGGGVSLESEQVHLF